MPVQRNRALVPLPTAVLEVLIAVPSWSRLPEQLAALAGPGRMLEALYRQGLPLERLHTASRQLVAAARSCPEPWPAYTQGLATAIETLRRATDCPFLAEPRPDARRTQLVSSR